MFYVQPVCSQPMLTRAKKTIRVAMHAWLAIKCATLASVSRSFRYFQRHTIFPLRIIRTVKVRYLRTLDTLHSVEGPGYFIVNVYLSSVQDWMSNAQFFLDSIHAQCLRK